MTIKTNQIGCEVVPKEGENLTPPTPIDTTETTTDATTNQKGISFWTAIVLAVIIVGVVGGIVGYYVAGNCSSGDCSTDGTTSTETSKNTPPNTSTTPTPAESPTTKQQQLTVACNFLNLPNLAECQARTYYSTGYSYRNTVGTTIPTEIGLLTQLTSLSLYDSQLAGTIPFTLGNLVQLTYLKLANTQLTGTIPSTIGNLVQLNYLNLFGNAQLTGTIPSALCSNYGIFMYIDCVNFGCSCCRHYVDYTLCPGTPSMTPPIAVTPTSSPTEAILVTDAPTESPITEQQQPLAAACDFLNIPDLVECQSITYFHGVVVGNTIPTELGLLTQLTELNLAYESLTGPIPSALGDLTQLNALRLYNNQLTGTIPSTLGDLTQLSNLRLYNNTRLTGTIPSTMCSISTIEIIIDCANIVCTCCLDGSVGESYSTTSCPGS